MAGEPDFKIRTMKSDLEEVVKKGDQNLVRALAERGDAGYKRGYTSPRERSLVKIGVALFLIFIVLPAIGLGGYLYFKKLSGQNTQVPTGPAIPRPLIVSASTNHIEIRGNDRTGLIDGIRSLEKKSTKDAYLYAPLLVTNLGEKTRLATPDDFFSILEASAPFDLLASFTGRWNIYGSGGNLVLIFETKDRLKTLGSMLGWEDKIASSLLPIVPDTPQPDGKKFEDLLIKNNDARIARLDPNGSSAIAYSIILEKFLIITTSEVSLRATVDRLIAGPIIY